MKNPYKEFEQWARHAKEKEPHDYDAAALATTDSKNRPDVRMVLVRRTDERGFVFFSHRSSAKGKQLAANPSAALNFHWKSTRRQVRIRGTIETINDSEADDYFAQRPRDHQLNALASRQSETLDERATLLTLFQTTKKKFARKPIPRPAHWVGFRLVPLEIEFWISKRSRQHSRTLYYRASAKAAWKTKKLFP